MAIYRYSRWDGTQAGFDLDADAVLSEIKDDLMYHGDVGFALRRMMQQGFRDRNGRHVEGLQELLERIREARRQEREQHDPGGAYQEIADELNEILAQEREALDRLEQEAGASGDERRREVTDEVVGERRAAARASSRGPRRPRARLSRATTSPRARRASASRQLLERLREETVQDLPRPGGGRRLGMRRRRRERIRNALDALNKMMEQRAGRRNARPELRAVHGAVRRSFPG